MVGSEASVLSHDAALGDCPANPNRSDHRLNVLAIFGTRPEAIKMAPVVRALNGHERIRTRICVTGQHREMLDQAMSIFGLTADVDLDIMRRAQGLTHVTTAILSGLEKVLARERPDCVLVHGDTTTTLAASLAAFYAGVPIGHVEAGLRTGDATSPWPEEMNRRMAGVLARIHFAPTARAAANLSAEGIDPRAIEITGNTAVDALHWVRDHVLTRPEVQASMQTRFGWLDPERNLILVTLHRREIQGPAMSGICQALARLAARDDVQIVCPVHPNPRVRSVVAQGLGNMRRVHLIPPQDYTAFAWLMARAKLVITDSGGIQEEAPSIGKPVLVTRETTERPEGITAGAVRLVGTDPDHLMAETERLLDSPGSHEAMARMGNPYGDGRAAARIADRLVREFVR